ncbi:MAG TPA: TIGR03936 family radical SAM-associated protein [Streptosporangiaceae bacterium]
MARPVPTGPPPAPTVQRLRIRYAKRGRMRFASHRDVARAIERGVRKAGIPVAYSAGFTPHPRISYSGGAPTGSASEAEYLELAVTRRCEPDDVGRRLDAALPDGIDVVEVVEVAGKSAGLVLEAAEWEVAWPGVSAEAAAGAIGIFLGQPEFTVQRLTSKGTKTVDVRAGVLGLTCMDAAPGDERRAGTDPAAGCAILRMIVRQMTPAVRPDDILAALRQLSDLEPGSPAVATRRWQGPMSELSAAQTGDQTGMIADRDAAGPGRQQRPQPASSGAAAPSQQDVPEPGALRPGPGFSPDDSGRMTDKATRLEAESAITAPAGQARANEQLPRGARGQFADPRAREPYGRDCPDARNRATQQQTVRAE